MMARMSQALVEADKTHFSSDESIFKSFWIGGFECSTHRLPRRKGLGRFAGLRLDLIEATRHDEFAFQDYARLQDAGMSTARDGVRWHLIEKTSSRYDFSSLIPMLRAARRTETQVIWDLLHYGWPDGLNIWGAAFVDRFARFARAVASVILEETGGPIYVTPVNEISFVSWGGGDAGFLNPFGSTSRPRAQGPTHPRGDRRDRGSTRGRSGCAYLSRRTDHSHRRGPGLSRGGTSRGGIPAGAV